MACHVVAPACRRVIVADPGRTSSDSISRCREGVAGQGSEVLLGRQGGDVVAVRAYNWRCKSRIYGLHLCRAQMELVQIGPPETAGEEAVELGRLGGKALFVAFETIRSHGDRSRCRPGRRRLAAVAADARTALVGIQAERAGFCDETVAGEVDIQQRHVDRSVGMLHGADGDVVDGTRSGAEMACLAGNVGKGEVLGMGAADRRDGVA